jgi:NADPH:quinone reductase-like Zn-dependent oxidoreductase
VTRRQDFVRDQVAGHARRALQAVRTRRVAGGRGGTGAGTGLVDVLGCGVNFPDVLIVQDEYQFKPELPFSPGGEVAGTVSAARQRLATSS